MAQSAAELATRERIRVALIGSHLETAPFMTILLTAQQAPQIADLFKPHQGGKQARAELLTLVAWLLILVHSGAVASTVKLKGAMKHATLVALVVLGDTRPFDTARKVIARLGGSSPMTLQCVRRLLDALEGGGDQASAFDRDELFQILHPNMRAAIAALGLSQGPDKLVVSGELLSLVAKAIAASADDCSLAASQPQSLAAQPQPQATSQPLQAAAPSAAPPLAPPAAPLAGPRTRSGSKRAAQQAAEPVDPGSLGEDELCLLEREDGAGCSSAQPPVQQDGP